jgi:LCP family protein required for cell wall assembly
MVARLILWAFACVLLTTITATLGGIAALLWPNSAPLPLESYLYPKRSSSPSFKHYHLSRPMNILVMGIQPDLQMSGVSPSPNLDSFSGLSDTMILIRFDPTDSSINLLWIPRDTQVIIPGYGKDKINQANAIGGSALAARVLSLNFNYVAIDRYVRIRPNALSELVDLLGGLEIFVSAPMSYTDISGKLTIDLKPGWQTLNGNQAIHFARFRNDELGDIGRIQRQQVLLRSLYQNFANPRLIKDLPKLILSLRQYIDTNLTAEEILTLVKFFTQVDASDLKMMLLPGKFSDPNTSDRSYWVVDAPHKKQIIQQYFDVESVQFQPKTDSRDKIKIAIQNANHDSEDSQSMAELEKYLNQQGFKNVYQIEPWPVSQQQTQILVENGNMAAAKALKDLLKVGKIEASSIGDINSDITIRLGRDIERQFMIERER